MLHFAQVFHYEQLSATEQFETLLLGANTVLALSFCLLLATILVCYPLAGWFSFELQLVSHVALIFSATLLKIAYICRCIAQYELQQEVR